MASIPVDLVLILIAIINIAAAGGALYMLADRYTCLIAAYRLLRCVHMIAPETYHYLTWPPPFAFLLNLRRFEEFLLSDELEVHDAVRHHKEQCRCWVGQYRSLSRYLLRIGYLALASPILVILLLLFIAVIGTALAGSGSSGTLGD